jgi:hypothetical protein
MIQYSSIQPKVRKIEVKHTVVELSYSHAWGHGGAPAETLKRFRRGPNAEEIAFLFVPLDLEVSIQPID